MTLLIAEKATRMYEPCVSCGGWVPSEHARLHPDDGRCPLCIVSGKPDDLWCCSGDYDNGEVTHRHTCPVLADEQRTYV